MAADLSHLLSVDSLNVPKRGELCKWERGYRAKNILSAILKLGRFDKFLHKIFTEKEE